MWIRRTPEEIEHLACEKEQSRKNPKIALLLALGLTILTFASWTFGGVRSRSNPAPSSAKSWEKIVDQGPWVFAGTFLLSFIFFYVLQRRRTFKGMEQTVFICPACYKPQRENDRQCTCAAKLEALEDWKWVN
jgi:hypothetical protein